MAPKKAQSKDAAPDEVAAASPVAAAHWKSLSAEERSTVEGLLKAGQAHLLAAWPPVGQKSAEKKALLAQVRAAAASTRSRAERCVLRLGCSDAPMQPRAQVKDLDAALKGTGGLAAYIGRARQLLEDSKNNKNPFDGFTPSVPEARSPHSQLLPPASLRPRRWPAPPPSAPAPRRAARLTRRGARRA